MAGDIRLACIAPAADPVMGELRGQLREIRLGEGD
jgi:hypothetical protein